MELTGTAINPDALRSQAIDSMATIERTERIASQLSELGVDNYIIRNQWNEALAVLVEEVVTPEQLEPIATAAMDRNYQADSQLPPAAGNVLPVDFHSGQLLPPDMLPVIDAAVQGALNDRAVRAVRLGATATGPWVGDARAHYDYPGVTDSYESGPLQGLNIHLTVGGEAAVRFGHRRSWQAVDDEATIIRGARNLRLPPVVGDLYIAQRLLTDKSVAFTPWVSSVPGDVLIFQAAAHRPDYLPIAHEFMSLTPERHIHVTTPLAAPEAAVLQARRHLVRQYGLEAYRHAIA